MDHKNQADGGNASWIVSIPSFTIVTLRLMSTLSPDGLIRLSLDELRSTQLTHLISGLDEDHPGRDVLVSSAAVANKLHITGYTEWVSQSTPTITVGWDWKMVGRENRIWLERISAPRSNIVIDSSTGVDVEQYKKARFDDICIESDTWLASVIDAMDWQTISLAYVTERYS